MRKCEKCSKFGVQVIGCKNYYHGMETLNLKEKVMARRLRCRECGDTFTSYEITSSDLDRYRNARRDFQKKIKAFKFMVARIEDALDVANKRLKELEDFDYDF